MVNCNIVMLVLVTVNNCVRKCRIIFYSIFFLLTKKLKKNLKVKLIEVNASHLKMIILFCRL